ncbi:hypothetical protein [Arabidopsis thaliana]|uniref:Putative BTB/POZ domain-containing protein At4g04090 n=1 Tax=Arabidopsis thaliana TaxID=3702 RepID=Y4409_ARATH|nr:BTB/POZ domain-containing protein [Arabidopsis thaliana]O81432.1 RecName: Full=Putative BTB/POZ domain-containing protein At4g04090 [Arabidopsis thaliana]AAC28212.1 T24H24.21 gene product [Arabidopsis thaliana]AEE82368.1 BTB/POZ domain-containing protein [Arabidopsis thaliana]CAB77877.1 hypothetical protein [Arabidopsis thaliana]|eukprot:NP_192318.1 BTB/POZ domain-containing protein [Arabidopsis thaliana]
MGTQTNKGFFYDEFLKVLKEQQVDVRLMARDSEKDAAISAHKRILSARSEVFEEMFESDKYKASSKLETITLSEMKHEVLEAFVDFTYSDGSMLSEKAKQHAMSLYSAAKDYEIPRLWCLCRKELIASLNMSNALRVLQLAQIPYDESLSVAAFTTIKNSKLKLSSSTKVKVFVVNHPNGPLEITRAIFPRN